MPRRLLIAIIIVRCQVTVTSMVMASDSAVTEPVPAVTRKIDFEQDVKPILESRCTDCHGHDDPEADFRILSRRSMLRGGESGEPSVLPSRSADSFLIKVVSGKDPHLKMPPDGPPLSGIQIAILRAWIDQGLEMPDDLLAEDSSRRSDHWSFQPVTSPDVPESSHEFASSEIDAFILARLQRNGLSPSPQAERRHLIRRLFLVMLGLPPTPEQIEAFVRDTSPDAWKNLVDRTLNSLHYGERWARHWLDLIRFGETHGFETNRERLNAWPYRDWVINSLNSDKPYDDFIRQQIAGDALGEHVATGFLVAGPHDVVKGQDPDLTLMQRQDELSDMINATTTAFLGMTIGCARCHNHKFDPITQRDFYAVQAVFAGVRHGDRKLPVPAERQERVARLRRQVQELRHRLREFIPASPPVQRSAVTATHNVDTFPAATAKFVRFTILKTNSSQPCIDELEVFSGERNVALSSTGAIATCSSSLPGYRIHQLAHINDGRYGNQHSWISNEPAGGWVQIEFPKPESISRIEWARDREGKYGDRVATEYRIEVAAEPGEWKLVSSSADRLPFGKTQAEEPEYQFDQAPEPRAELGRKWLAKLRTLRQQADDLATVQTAYAGTFQQPGPTHRLYRGDHRAKREIVAPDAIESLGSLNLPPEPSDQQRRMAFAEWIASPDNPLTPRVIVNRIWQFHFGTGLVDTPSDFGAAGTRPTHPELLDWLAQDLMKNNWSLKHIHRRILMSRTWRQDSRPDSNSLKIDGTSRLLWRFPPRRVEAEVIRDSILAVSGKLDKRMGGPGFSGFEVEMENVRHFHPKSTYGPEDFRRMVYMTKVRQEQESVFGSFDCPDASQVTPERSRSTTPLQALNLLNSSFVNEQAGFFAERLAKESPSPEAARIIRAYELCFGRQPDGQELSNASSFINESGRVQFCRAMLNASEFVFIP